eukprot:764869-Hanusia_phi.AAC.4
MTTLIAPPPSCRSYPPPPHLTLTPRRTLGWSNTAHHPLPIRWSRSNLRRCREGGGREAGRSKRRASAARRGLEGDCNRLKV